ncbi:MAG: glycoside hydrolase family 92 protein [Mycobacteriaceae bacterium]|nr:glycoside hydrolase family 92 protein [Mycobacteriaceae bacterium]
MADLLFCSSFEPGEHQPVDPMLRVGIGPVRSFTARIAVGLHGRHALKYHDPLRATLFEVDIPVTEHTELSYAVFPESDGFPPQYRATYVALDVEFDDGSAAGFTAAAQGESKTLYLDQWNLVRSRLGAHAGRRVRRILIDCATSDQVGWIDDVRLEERIDAHRDAVDWVRTTRGTHSSADYSRGNTFPAVATPHGFNFWTPVTDAGTLDWIYSYHRHNTARNRPALEAFALSHQPSPWMGDRNTFHVMPGVGPVEADRGRRALEFAHEHEIDRPYQYGVRFDNGITVDLAPTEHAAIVRIRFPEAGGWLLFDNVDIRSCVRVHRRSAAVAAWTAVRSGLSAGSRRMHIHAEADAPVVRGGRKWLTLRRPGYLVFEHAEVTLRIGTSLLGADQARRNMEREIPAGETFEQVRDRARAQWQDLLCRFEIEGATADQRTTFYSSLYRLFLYPNVAHEDTPDGVRHASPVARGDAPGRMYVNNGFWDTYRTCWPAYALLTPRRCGEMIDGFVRQYREGGWIARWSSPGYADLMTGTSSDVAFADAYLKGVTNFDVESAYLAALKNATVTPPAPAVGRKGLERSIFLGWTPTSVKEGMSWALEGCVNDFGLANMAEALGRPDEAAYFRSRAQQYVHHFDPNIGFFQGRTDDGGRREQRADRFDPGAWGGDYTETNAWTMAFAAPHDGPGLAALYGGLTGLEAKLDQYFNTPETALKTGSYSRAIHEMLEARDVRMGQYGHSNQPAHHIAYMYLYAGAPAKTQRAVREILRRLYLGSDLGQGYCGDEDNGEMSAWYILSALGIYPLTVGSPQYAIGAPLFTKAVVHLDNGRDLVVRAPGNTPDSCYVRGLTVNGEPYHRTTIDHAVLAAGAELVFDLADEPTEWGEPPAPARHPNPLVDLPGRAHSSDGAAAALFDDTTLTETAFNTSTPTVVFTPDDPAREVVMYTLTSASRPGDPAAWALEGSMDGASWTVLDERSDQEFRWRRQTRPFLLPAPARCARYRLRVTRAAAPVRLAQLEFLSPLLGSKPPE